MARGRGFDREAAFDFVAPVFGNSALGKSLRDTFPPSIDVKSGVRYQACDEAQCFIPPTRTLDLKVPLGETPRPAFKGMEFMRGPVIDVDTEADFRRLAAHTSKPS